MTVLETETAAFAGMSENLWLEKACSILIPALPLWIIEYAWTKQMMEVLEGVSNNVFFTTQTNLHVKNLSFISYYDTDKCIIY